MNEEKCNKSLGTIRGKERICTLPKGHKDACSWWEYPSKELLDTPLPCEGLTTEEKIASIGW